LRREPDDAPNAATAWSLWWRACRNRRTTNCGRYGLWRWSRIVRRRARRCRSAGISADWALRPHAPGSVELVGSRIGRSSSILLDAHPHRTLRFPACTRSVALPRQRR